jgi:hypothetical protein
MQHSSRRTWMPCLALASCVVFSPTGASAKVTMTQTSCLGTQRCTRLSNGTVDVLVTRDVGPRVISYGFTGEDNVFAQLPQAAGKPIDASHFSAWGGHRLWHAPEQEGRTYVPDNVAPQFVELAPGHIRLTAPAEALTNLQKEMELKIDPVGTRVTIVHRLKNVGPWAIEAAPWSISIMRGGGSAIIPNEPVQDHGPAAFLPARQMALWSYTNLADVRFRLGPTYTRVSAKGSEKSAQKVGFGNRQGWVGYLRDGGLFVKRMSFDKSAVYPDFGCNAEVYTAGDFIEVESLSPLRSIAPGQSAQHLESWYLFGGVKATNELSDPALAVVLNPLVAKTEPPQMP